MMGGARVVTAARGGVTMAETGADVFEGEHPDHCPVCGSMALPAARGSGPGGRAGESGCPQCGHLLWFASRRVGDVTVIRLLDNRVAVMELLELLENAVTEGAVDRMVLNFGSIQQVSSAALGKLIKLQGRSEAVRGRLRLCGVHPDLRRVFKITRLDGLFDLHDTEAEALAAFAAEPRA
jgi:anti-sigma B factor antagonist